MNKTSFNTNSLFLKFSKAIKEKKNFYKTCKDRLDISTPSYDQVTSPLYSKSLNRWKNYEKEFEGVKNILDRWANEFDYKI